MAILTSKPVVGSDVDAWGPKVNTDLDTLDAAIVADRVRLTALEARRQIYVGPTAPTDTTLIWIDTSV